MRLQRPTRALLLAVLALLGAARSRRAEAGEGNDISRERSRRTIQDAKVGLFVEWGVYTLLGKGAMVMERDRLPISEYEKLPPRFHPGEFDPETWVKTARSAGTRYLVVTAKHHDGFCMFESKLTRYDMVDATPYAKDPLKAIAAACRKHGLPLVVSYSLLDWHHPDYAPRGQTGKSSGRDDKGDWSKYVAYYQGQVRELCTNYGPLAGVWLEGAWDRPDAPWDLQTTYDLIHTHQPGALVASDRQSTLRPAPDVVTIDHEPRQGPDQDQDATEPSPIREVHQNVNAKGVDETIRLLVTLAARGSNLVLVVAPRPDGAISAQTAERLAGIGLWLDKQGTSIYATRPGPLPPQAWGVSTRDGGAGSPSAIYLHVLQPVREIRLPEVMLSFDARRLGATELLPTRQDGKQVVVKLPEPDPSQPVRVIVLTPRMLGR